MPEGKPWLKWYPSDWRADQALRICSLAARGLWIEMLCIMHESSRPGLLLINDNPVTETHLGLMTGASPDQVGELIAELESAGVFSRNREGVIYSRRMTRDHKKEAAARREGSKGGNPKLKGEERNEGYIYLAGVRNDGRYRIGASVNPRNRLKKIRAQYRDDDIRIIETWSTDHMGTLERTLHEIFAEKGENGWFSLTEQDTERIGEIVDPKGSRKGDPKQDPSPQRPEARDQNTLGSGLERRSLSPGGHDPPPTQPDPKKFAMTAEWVMPSDLHDELTAEHVPKLGVEPFWRQIKRFAERHAGLGTEHTETGFAELLRGWLSNADANREGKPQPGAEGQPNGSASDGNGHDPPRNRGQGGLLKFISSGLQICGKSRSQAIGSAGLLGDEERELKWQLRKIYEGHDEVLGVKWGPNLTPDQVFARLPEFDRLAEKP